MLGSFKGMKWWHALLIKLLQLVLKRGLTEIDDVMHSVVGCMMGYWMIVGWRKVVCIKNREKSKLE